MTYAEAFTVQPFGNSLVTMTLNSQQIRDTLEQQFANCLGTTATTRVLLPSGQLHYEWDLNAAGYVVEPARAWRVTVNNFMADGGDGFTVLKSGANRVGGGQDIDALSAYLAAYKAPQCAA